MKIKNTPMRTVTYLGVDVQIPAHHTAVAADGCGQVYSYADTPIEITTCWRSSNSYDSPYKVPARVDFAETVEWRNSLQLYPLAKTIRIGEYDVPEPVREPLEDDKEYWGVDPMAEEFAWNYKWHNAAFCNLRLRRGLIHLTKEAAVIHAKALLSLTKAAD